MSDAELWRFLPLGYLLTILLETPILMVGLRAWPLKDRLLAGVWLTACTYPVVVLVLPQLMNEGLSRGAYLVIAETFAPLAECMLFRLGFISPDTSTRWRWQAYATITLANLFSFLTGEWLGPYVWPWLGF